MDVLSELPLRAEPVMIRQDLLPSARSARASAVIVDGCPTRSVNRAGARNA